MDPILASALISGSTNILGGIAGGNAQQAAANKAYEAQKDAIIKMQEMLEAVGIPSVEAQKLALERPEFAGELIAEKLGPSALEEIQTDFRTRDAQLDALRELQKIGEVGLTPEERAQRSEMMRESAAQNQAQQQQILQSMAQRGALDSGASLIAQLQANAQESADARRQSEQMAADVASRRRDAIMRAANLAGNVEQAEFGRQARIADAQDAINRFNIQTSNQAQERNLDARQRYADQIAALSNKEQQYNKELLQQDYLNRLSRTQAQANLVGQMGQAQANMALQQGAATAGQATGMGAAFGNIATAVGGYMSRNPNASFFGGGSSNANYDNMSFGSAFNKAYDDIGEGGTFNWKGNDYALKRK